jgi:hypothetical protein
MEVQWYCPPAVGYTLASSARMAAQQPTSTKMTIGPYTRIAGPPSGMVREKVAAIPAPLLQMFQLAETVSQRVMTLGTSAFRSSPLSWSTLPSRFLIPTEVFNVSVTGFMSNSEAMF